MLALLLRFEFICVVKAVNVDKIVAVTGFIPLSNDSSIFFPADSIFPEAPSNTLTKSSILASANLFTESTNELTPPEYIPAVLLITSTMDLAASTDERIDPAFKPLTVSE